MYFSKSKDLLYIYVIFLSNLSLVCILHDIDNDMDDEFEGEHKYDMNMNLRMIEDEDDKGQRL